MAKVYVIGSLRNPAIGEIAGKIRSAGHEVFDDWRSAGPDADDHWRDYEKARGHSYLEGLYGPAATNVFEFDRRHLEWCDTAVLVMPAGKSAHLELGWCLGQGKRGLYLLESGVDRWDVMLRFATEVFDNLEELISHV